MFIYILICMYMQCGREGMHNRYIQTHLTYDRYSLNETSSKSSFSKRSLPSYPKFCNTDGHKRSRAIVHFSFRAESQRTGPPSLTRRRLLRIVSRYSWGTQLGHETGQDPSILAPRTVRDLFRNCLLN